MVVIVKCRFINICKRVTGNCQFESHKYLGRGNSHITNVDFRIRDVKQWIRVCPLKKEYDELFPE